LSLNLSSRWRELSRGANALLYYGAPRFEERNASGTWA
jgi:hypothetical protein